MRRFGLVSALVLVTGLACHNPGRSEDPGADSSAQPRASKRATTQLPPLTDPQGFALAPAIEGEWVEGEPFELASESRVVIVEQWATWCGPCREVSPLLSALQAEYVERLRVVGVSTEPEPVVARFLDANRALMRYDVVAEGGPTWVAYRAVGAGEGIPYAYIVRDQRLLWHGHPGELGAVFDTILAGAWTPELAQLSATFPERAQRYFELCVAGQVDEARALAPSFLEELIVDPYTQNEIAWLILTEVPQAHRDLPLALELAERAVLRTNRSEWTLLDTLALALWETGATDRAVTVQGEAVRLCRETIDGGGPCHELDQRLQRFRGATVPGGVFR